MERPGRIKLSFDGSLLVRFVCVWPTFGRLGNMMRSVTTHDQGLPEYESPPVVEVALAVQLDRAVGCKAHHLAEIARRWEDDHPNVEERTPLPTMGFGSDGPDLTLDVSDKIETPRLWLQSAAGDRVVQLQQDRIVVNWKQGTAAGTYPRYRSIRKALLEAWNKLSASISDLDLDLPQPSICEVQYINHLGPSQGWRSAEDTQWFIAPWNGTMSDEFLPTDHHGRMLLHFHLPEKRGWLNIEGWTTDREGGEKLFVLRLTSRGRASSPDIDDALDFMDLAHEWIVRGFTSATTAEAHKKWGRTQ